MPSSASLLAAFCSTLAGGHGLKGRDAFRPDAFRRLRRAAEGKGGAAWRRDRSHAQPRAAPGFGREHGEHGEDLPLARSEHRGTPISLQKNLFFFLFFLMTGYRRKLLPKNSVFPWS